MTILGWLFVILGVLASGLFIERMWRLHDQRLSLTQRTILGALFVTGSGAVAYGAKDVLDGFYGVGTIAWHLAAVVLIALLEVMFLSLRVEQIGRRAAGWIIARCSVVTAATLFAWPQVAAGDRGIEGVAHLSEHSVPSFVFLVVFPLYVIWGLSQIVVTSISMIPRNMRRRPINTLAFALVASGLICFIVINTATTVFFNTGRSQEAMGVIVYSPISLGLCVAGAALLASGERVYDELSSRYQLLLLGPLWRRMIELSDRSFHLPTSDLSAPARLQRAYVEISDAMCTLRVPAGRTHDLGSVVAVLDRGEVCADAASPTISEALPARSTRREDLEAIEALAAAYRRR